MKKIFRFLIFLLVVAGVLALLKPSESNFEEWMRTDSAKKRANAKGENLVERMVDKGLTTATQVQILATYQYTNHYVVAIVDATANGEEYTYLGIAKTWVKIP